MTTRLKRIAMAAVFCLLAVFAILPDAEAICPQTRTVRRASRATLPCLREHHQATFDHELLFLAEAGLVIERDHADAGAPSLPSLTAPPPAHKVPSTGRAPPSRAA